MEACLTIDAHSLSDKMKGPAHRFLPRCGFSCPIVQLVTGFSGGPCPASVCFSWNLPRDL